MEGSEKAYLPDHAGIEVRPLCVSEVSLMPVLIAGTLYTFDRDMKRLLKRA